MSRPELVVRAPPARLAVHSFGIDPVIGESIAVHVGPGARCAATGPHGRRPDAPEHAPCSEYAVCVAVFQPHPAAVEAGLVDGAADYRVNGETYRGLHMCREHEAVFLAAFVRAGAYRNRIAGYVDDGRPT